MTGRNTQVSRIYRILDILDGLPDGLSVSELRTRLADRGHEASKRTIYRDLEALEQAGFPLFPDSKDPNEGQRWRLERTARVTNYLALAPKELVALFLARGMLAPLRDTPFYADLQAVFQKLEDKLGSRNLDYFRSLEGEFQFEPSPKWGLGLSPDHLDTIRAAISEGQQLQMTYYSVNSNKTSERKVGPHYLYFAKGSLYLVAEDLSDQTTKVFSVPRVKEATMLDAVYEGKISTPEDFFGSSFGIFQGNKAVSVQLEFSQRVGSYVRERSWHHSQRVVSREGGRVELSLEVGLTPEFVGWVLSFGADVRVMAPVALQEELRERAKAVVEQYKRGAA